MQFILNTLSIILLSSLFGHAESGDGCKNLKPLKYELFGTKTIYKDALNFLKSDDQHTPKSFDDDTLEEEHSELVGDSCKPIVFYFVGRHSARFPDGEDIDAYNKKLSDLKDAIKTTEAYKKCPTKFSPLVNWAPKMQFKHDNLITHLGAEEERNISRRFKKIYPDFFKTSKSDIEVGCTSKLRTAQTGMEFLREVEGLNLPNCDLNKLPTNDVSKPDYNIDRILQDACYKSLTEKSARPFLEFHKQCERISGKSKIKDPFVDRVKNPEVVRKIAEDMAERLGLSERSKQVVSADVLDAIWNMCKFENAMQDNSVWCPLLSRSDVEALEYIEDVNSYRKDAYGPEANAKQACPLVSHLANSLEAAKTLTGSSGEKKRSHFYFSHADPIKKLLAALELFKDDKSFEEDDIREFERELKVPSKRDWRSSVVSPFSANVAFVLYRCPDSKDKASLKILTTVNERPVKLRKCKKTACSRDDFIDSYGSLLNCDLNKVCARS